MKVKELLNIRQTRIVALDGKNGKVLFDTSKCFVSHGSWDI